MTRARRKRTNIVRCHLRAASGTVRFVETESDTVVLRGCVVGGNEELVLSGYTVSVWDDAKFWKSTALMVTPQWNVLSATDVRT